MYGCGGTWESGVWSGVSASGNTYLEKGKTEERLFGGFRGCDEDKDDDDQDMKT